MHTTTQTLQLTMFKANFKLLNKAILGSKYTPEYKIYYKNPVTSELGSFFHDIPLKSEKDNDLYNMVVEIPQHTNPKYEVSKTDILNPIIQDTKKGKMRFINNLFPHKGYIATYGSIPQTWEDPAMEGDNDPLDVLDISTGRKLETGDIQQVKILGSLGLIDDGEIDWKIISISNQSSDFGKVNSLDDVDKIYPGLLKSIRFWFENYKVNNEQKNQFLHDGRFLNKEETLSIIKECHLSWKKLMSKSEVEMNIKDPVIFTEKNVSSNFKKDLKQKLKDFKSKKQTEELAEEDIEGYDCKWYFK